MDDLKRKLNDYSSGTVLAEDFDNVNYLRYSTSDEALVRSSNSQDTGLSQNEEPGEENEIYLIWFQKATRTLGTRKHRISRLFEVLNVPKAAVAHLFFAWEPLGFFSNSSESTLIFWYHIPVENFGADGFEHDQLHVIQVSDSKMSRRRVIVLYPPFMKADILLKIPAFFYDQDPDAQHPFHVHETLIRASLHTWLSLRWAVMSMCSTSLLRQGRAIGKALDVGPIEDCNNSVSRLNLNISYISKLSSLIQLINLYFKAGPRLPQNASPQLIHNKIQNLQNDVNFLMDSYTFLKDQLLLQRQTLTTSITIMNASYMRTNTIALRRIGEATRKDNEEAKKQTAASEKNSQSMTKIAYMTMFYLPASFVASLFGMPFLDLNHAKKFENLDKIWIYVVGAVISTVVTFLCSIAWDMVLVSFGKRSGKVTETDIVVDPDNQVLEPTPYLEPSFKDLLEGLSDVLNTNPANNEADDDDEANGSGTNDSNLDEDHDDEDHTDQAHVEETHST